MGAEDELSDEELAVRAGAGDETLVHPLFQRHTERLGKRIYLRLSIEVRTRYSVSDALQETFVAAWKALPSFRPRGEGSFARWLSGICDKKVFDILRRHYRDGRRPPEGTPVPRWLLGLAGQHSPSSEARRLELRERLKACLEELPHEQRAAAQLVIGRGMTNREAGERLGVSADAVRLRVNRARKSLWMCISRGLEG